LLIPLAVLATALADFVTSLTSLPRFRSFAFAMAPQPMVWRAVVTWPSAVAKVVLDCRLMANAKRFAMRTSPHPHPVWARCCATDPSENLAHAQAAFNSLAMRPATCCDPGGLAAVSFTVFVAGSKGSGFAPPADWARATPSASTPSFVHVCHPIADLLGGHARAHLRPRLCSVANAG
jgi:hypothetical protein